MTTEYKTCSKCGFIKNKKKYTKDKSKKDGLYPSCKIYPKLIENHKIKVNNFILLYGLPTQYGNIIEGEE